MNRWRKHAAEIVVAWAAVLLAAEAGGETCKLELKRLSSSSRVSDMSQMMFRSTQPQHFFVQTGRQGMPARQPGEADFAKVIKKQPAKYLSKHPFRGVAKLGTQQFGWVLDGESKKGRNESTSATLHYNRLVFDLNHNGDLTDDKVVKAESPNQMFSQVISTYAQYSFPRVDVTVESSGTKVEYAFFFSVYSNSQSDYQYASASLNSAVYREGTISLDGKERRIVMVDNNSNGRFDDATVFDDNVRMGDGTAYPTLGDMIYVDPVTNSLAAYYGYDVTANDAQNLVATVLNVDGKYYDLKVTPAGDELTLTPAKSKLGFVDNPNAGFRAVVYGDKMALKIVGDDSGRAPLPAGDWKLASYTIDRSKVDSELDAAKPESSLMERLSNAFLGRSNATSLPQPRLTMVSARAVRDTPAVTVKEGETTRLPFGPPYQPQVEVSYRQGSDNVSLGMSLVGSAGELCSNLMVNNSRPADPTFSIIDPRGKEVESGRFEYG